MDDHESDDPETLGTVQDDPGYQKGHEFFGWDEVFNYGVGEGPFQGRESLHVGHECCRPRSVVRVVWVAFAGLALDYFCGMDSLTPRVSKGVVNLCCRQRGAWQWRR